MSREDRAENLHEWGEREIERGDFRLPLQPTDICLVPTLGFYLQGKIEEGTVAGYHSQEGDIYFLIRDLQGNYFAIKCDERGKPMNERGRAYFIGKTEIGVRAGLQRLVDNVLKKKK